MAKVDENKIAEFTNLLFSSLDDLKLFPKSLKRRDATPTRLEKYPRLLFGYIRRYNNIEAAFEEWKSKVLRDVDSKFLRFEKVPELESLKRWCIENKELFEGNNQKINLQHLRGSLFARIYQFLYTRRLIAVALVNYFKEDHNIDKNLSDEKTIKLIQTTIQSEFEQIMEKLEEIKLKKIKGIYGNDWELKKKEGKEFFLSNLSYYIKLIKGEKKEVEQITDSENQLNEEELNNE